MSGRYRRQSDEVFYRSSRGAGVAAEDVAFLRSQAEAAPRRRARLCLHPDPSARQHEMLIVHHRSCYVRPHRHIGRSECLLVLEGQADLISFKDDGAVCHVLPLAAYPTDANFVARVEEGTWHTLVIQSDWFVFFESTVGPFDPKAVAFPPWAPDGRDVGAADLFVDRIRAVTM